MLSLKYFLLGFLILELVMGAEGMSCVEAGVEGESGKYGGSDSDLVILGRIADGVGSEVVKSMIFVVMGIAPPGTWDAAPPGTLISVSEGVSVV